MCVTPKLTTTTTHHLTTHPFNQLQPPPRAFAPSIHGHEHVKLALLLALFSGVEKNVYNKVVMRDETR